jgi:hypothetical protein
VLIKTPTKNIDKSLDHFCIFYRAVSSKWAGGWFYYHKGYVILQVWYSVLKNFCHSNYIYFTIFQRTNKKCGNKIEKELKLSYWSEYFKTLVYRKIDSSLIVYILFGDFRFKIAMNILQFILWFSPHFKVIKCQFNPT